MNTQHSQTKLINNDTCVFFKYFLAMKKGSTEMKYNAQVASVTVILFDNYSVDFNLINGNLEDPPYLDVVLFNNGQEIQHLDPVFVTLNGDYKFHDRHGKKDISLTLKTVYGF